MRSTDIRSDHLRATDDSRYRCGVHDTAHSMEEIDHRTEGHGMSGNAAIINTAPARSGFTERIVARWSPLAAFADQGAHAGYDTRSRYIKLAAISRRCAGAR
jgi:hypothetical protein